MTAATDRKTETTVTPEKLLHGKVLLRVDEVCAILSIGKSLAYDMVACQELESTRVRGAVRVYASSVRAYLYERENKKRRQIPR